MIKHKEISTHTSCLNKAADDEPVFVLRANDETAPEIIRQWAKAYRAVKAAYGGGALTPEQLAKYDEAMALARSMELWKAQQAVNKAVARAKT